MTAAAWEGVRDPKDRRRYVYWRLVTGPNRTDALGAVSHKDGAWRAIGYDWTAGNPAVTEFGMHSTKKVAQRVVEERTVGGAS